MSPAVGPYSPVRRVGDWVITSGQVGLATDLRHRRSVGICYSRIGRRFHLASQLAQQM